MRTYSRSKKRSLYDEEPPVKRRRVGTAEEESLVIEPLLMTKISTITSTTPLSSDDLSLPTSSPKASAIFSDEQPRSSPPSSPAPRSSPPPQQKRRPVFSVFKKQARAVQPTKQPLAERSHNAQSQLPDPAKKKGMVQMQLDLVGEHRKQCKTCGMEYIPSSAEDAALHKKFHAMNLGGVDFTKSIVERLRKKQIWGGGEGAFIAVVSRNDALALRHRASEVLKVVNTELAAIPIDDGELWGQAGRTVFADAPIEQSKGPTVQAIEGAECLQPLVDRFKMYLYIKDNKCIGACLVERIWEAYAVLSHDDASEPSCQLPSVAQSSSISIGTTSSPAMLGISRVWTSSEHRKKGIATRLLESVRSDFLYGLTIEKEQMAFSQPTERGQNLARKWFRKASGWLVYID